MTAHQLIGTVDVLAPRIYKLDMNGDGQIAPTEILVQPGTYPVYRAHESIYWLLTGQINNRFQRVGDGMLVLRNMDKGEGPEVVVPSRIYGPDEFKALLAESLCQEGHVDQRMRFHLEGVTT